MNLKMQKFMSILLTLCMLLSFAQFPAMAAEGDEEATTTNGYYDADGNWVAGGTGSKSYDVDGTEVTLSKTAAPVAGKENTFEITLQVTTSTTTTTYTDGGAVVLVIDTSNSMKYCAECGGTYSHERSCPLFENGWGADNSIAGEEQRIYAAKVAASSFLKSYAGTDPAAPRMLAIAYFNAGYGVSLDWVNVAGGPGNNEYDTARSKIWGLSCSMGTNMEGGLYQALQMLNDDAVSHFTAKNVVLLSDGAPSVRMNNSSVGEEKADCDAAARRAAEVKATGADLYTVCFGAAGKSAYPGGPSVSAFLRDSIASSGCSYDADNSSELYAAFAAITESITSGLSGLGWTATDPMADMISVTGGTSPNFASSDNDTYTWTLSDAKTVTEGNKTTYIYTYKYIIELDVQGENFVEGQFFPTNEQTWLHVGEETLEFPVPGVKGVLPRTDVTVTKVWDDADNQDGLRTASVTVQLMEGDRAIGEAVTLSAENGWTYTWDGETYDLIAMSKGQPHVYTVKELDVPTGYEAACEPNEENGFDLIIRNTHVPAKKDITVTKIWDDADNQDGLRPGAITVNLLADGVVVASAELNEANGWSYTFSGYPVYKASVEIAYTAEEAAVPDGYTASYSEDTLTITNSHTTAKTSVEVTKIWDDADNQDGLRPASITVELYADGVATGKTLTISGNSWTGTFSDLDKYANGKEIQYTVKETEVPGYTASYSEDTLTITNSHTPAVTEISGHKIWEDNDNQDGKRPASITINLCKNGEIIDTKVVTEADGWAWTFANLPKFENGTQITYYVTEVAVDGYTTTYNGYNVTNTHTPEQTSVTVSKAWVDSNNQDGIRATEITVRLLADGVDTGKTVVLNDGNNWTDSFTGLNVYANGTAIVYTIEEIEVPGYTTEITGNQSSGFVVTNTHEIETVSFCGEKIWMDNDNQDGVRPASITVNLLANGEVVDSITVTAEDNWQWMFEHLPKYENQGNLIIYSITENVVEDYVTTYNGFNVINTHAPEQTSVTVTKSWQDKNDQDGIRPNEVIVVLLANGRETGKTLTLSEGNHWTGSFTDLDKFAGGKEIAYTIRELEVPGYSTEIAGDQSTGYIITNAHNPETTAVSGTKTWIDNDDQDGKRPESITINLLADGVVIDTITVTAEDNWSWTFENLAKYRDHGTLVVYSFTEESVEGYVTSYNGTTVINTHSPEKTSVTVTKAWADKNNQDGIRPNDVTVYLLANGQKTGESLVLSGGNNWTDSFTDLDKYADGKIIVYTVEEKEVDGYTAVITGDQDAGYTITNSHNPATVSFCGEKTWYDNDNQDGKRPASITINLLANGQVIDSVTVTEADNWQWMFEHLPKYENQGNLIYYSISENAVDGYTTIYDGLNVVNIHTPEEISLTVSKAWMDNNNQDGIRPDTITVILLADGIPTGDILTLGLDGQWTGSFVGLPKYSNGEEIAYTVAEVAIDGYETVITGDVVTGYIITNSHTPATTEVSGAKTWDDNNNQDGKRPESITVNLLANGQVVQTLTVTEAENWSWSFTNLPKYENGGVEIVYAITEDAVEGYSTTYDGYNITNSYTPAEVSLTVTKAWADSDNKEGKRPGKITVTLYANGELTKEKLVLTAEDNWSGSFVGLPKYENGVEIVYTIGEVAVKDYNTVIRGDMTSGFVITNSRTEIPQTGDERNPILWAVLMLSSLAVVAYVEYDSRKRRMAK